MSEQEWVKSGDDSVGIKEAGFKVLQVSTITSGMPRRRAQYLVSLFPVRQRSPFISNMPSMWCGVKTSNYCVRVSVAASLVSMAVGASALRRGGHLVATVSSFLERYATGCGSFPSCWTKTPKAIRQFSALYGEKGVFKLGMPKPGDSTRACLILLKAWSHSFSHIMGSMFGPLVAS